MKVLLVWSVSAVAVFAQTPRALVNQNCLGCHNDKLKSGGFSWKSVSLAHPEQSAEQVEKVIQESFEKAEQDFADRQVREQRVEADAILLAVEKARKHDAYFELAEEERTAIDKSINELLLVYHTDDHHLIAAKIEEVNQATIKLAENMLKGAQT